MSGSGSSNGTVNFKSKANAAATVVGVYATSTVVGVYATSTVGGVYLLQLGIINYTLCSVE